MGKMSQQRKRHENRYAHLAAKPPSAPSLASQHKEKRPYRTMEYALRVRSLMQSKIGLPFNVYQCAVCGAFHVGKALQMR